MPRKPWGEAELLELAAVKPRDVGAITRHAEKHGRESGAVSARLHKLRLDGEAEDVAHKTPRRFRQQIKLTSTDHRL